MPGSSGLSRPTDRHRSWHRFHRRRIHSLRRHLLPWYQELGHYYRRWIHWVRPASRSPGVVLVPGSTRHDLQMLHEAKTTQVSGNAGKYTFVPVSTNRSVYRALRTDIDKTKIWSRRGGWRSVFRSPWRFHFL